MCSIRYFLRYLLTHNSTYVSKNGSFLEKKNRFVTTLDLIKGFKQIKLQRLHHTCAPISELPSNISTMFKSVKLKNVNKKQHS